MTTRADLMKVKLPPEIVTGNRKSFFIPGVTGNVTSLKTT